MTVSATIRVTTPHGQVLAGGTEVFSQRDVNHRRSPSGARARRHDRARDFSRMCVGARIGARGRVNHLLGAIGEIALAGTSVGGGFR